MNVPFDMKKLALITINGKGLSIAFGNPKKNNEQFDLPVRGGKFELDL
jgi:hypothetical protein